MMEFLRKYFLIVTILVSVCMHLPFLNLPPKSVHLWRQSHTLAVARNFYTEEMNIFSTRVDNRMDTDGITGSHFPLFEFILAGIYSLTGEAYWVQRTYCLLLHIFGIVGIYKLVRFLWNNELMAALACWSFAWSPLLFYYGISALPDNLALPFSIWGLYFSMAWLKKVAENGSDQFIFMLLGFLFFTMAGLTKIQYLAAGSFVFGYLIRHRSEYSRVQFLNFGLFGALCSALCLLWYYLAIQKIKRSGLADFGLELKPEADFSAAFDILKANIIGDLPELILNFSGAAFIGFGFFFLIKKKKILSPLVFPLLIWALVLVAYHLLELAQMKHHDYYMMPYLPLLCILMAYGVHSMILSKWRILAVFLLFFQPIFAGLRIIPARLLKKTNGPEAVFYEAEALKKLQEMVPDNELCVVGPDNSRCIYFYFLRKKGFGFHEEYLSSGALQDFRKRGARYLYSSGVKNLEEDSLQNHLKCKIGEVGEFSVFEFKP